MGTNAELTQERSRQQADIIATVGMLLSQLDVAYCEHVAKAMRDQASRQEAMSILNPGHALKKNDLLRAQGRALAQLCSYVRALQRVDALKEELGVEEAAMDQVRKLFVP